MTGMHRKPKRPPKFPWQLLFYLVLVAGLVALIGWGIVYNG